MDGCTTWRPLGITCVLTEEVTKDDIRVIIDHSPCVEDKDRGGYTIAQASADHIISVRTACFARDDAGIIDAHELSAIMGHEIGHQLGIWEHVPESCDGKPQMHPEGGPVCGPALMNAYYDASVYFITAEDELAFDLRDTNQAVISGPAAQAVAGGPNCHLLKR